MSLRRFIASLATLVVSLLGLLQPGAAIAASALAPPAHAYTSQSIQATDSDAYVERGPPNSPAPNTIDAVAGDRWSHGASARPDAPSPSAIYDYDDTAPLAQVAGVASTLQGLAEVARPSPPSSTWLNVSACARFAAGDATRHKIGTVLLTAAGARTAQLLAAARTDPLIEFANANRGSGIRFASEYTSPSGAKYYDVNGARDALPEGHPLSSTGHHGGCAEFGCLLQAYEAEGPAAIQGGQLRTVYVRGSESPIPPGPPTGHGAPASPCGKACQPLLDTWGWTGEPDRRWGLGWPAVGRVACQLAVKRADRCIGVD